METTCACDCNCEAPASIQLPAAFQEVVVETDFRLYLAYVDMRGIWRDVENHRPIFGVVSWYEAKESDSTFLKRLAPVAPVAA